jgi:GNAT superfamily N-acetyltransferase
MTAAERVQAVIRTVNATEREVVRAGAFVLYRHPRTDHRYLNYAVPAEGATAWTGIDELRAAFAARELTPRLEFVAECAPGLEQALAAAGFELEARLPVMTCALADMREVPIPEGVVISRVLADADVRPLLEISREAFGEDPPDEAEVAGYDGHGFLARLGGVPAGSASRSPIADAVSELAGIGVLERFRRRGIAAALTAAAAADAFAAGATLCFLTPGDDGAERIYARAGFARSGTTMVHMVG